MSVAPEAPRRRPSKAVYRRRRLVALLGLIAIIVLVIVLIARCSSGSAPTPTPTPTASPSVSLIPLVTPTATSTPTPGAQGQYVGDAKECQDGALEVGAFTDKTGYGQGEQPQLTMTVTNKGSTDCKVNVGTSEQLFQITSGDDVWWQSTDCQTEKSDFWILLTAGQTEKTGSPIAWVRERSSPDTCNSAREAAVGGGASYYLTTSLGGVQSKESKQFLLN